MSVKPYIENNKKYYEVYVNGFDAQGRRIQRRKRCIETLRKAEIAEFEFKRELAQLRENKVHPRWTEWLEECVNRMKLTQRPSTVVNYDKQLRKWTAKRWASFELGQISTSDIHRLVFDEVDQNLSPNTRRTILKMVRRVFQMAMDEGIIVVSIHIFRFSSIAEVDEFSGFRRPTTDAAGSDGQTFAA